MANKTITYDSFKRGDTPVFGFTFTQPYVGYNWANVRVDTSITNVAAPSDNTGAGAVRLNQTLTVDATNSATYLFQLTVVESKALVPGSKYKVECQLKENSGLYVTTPITGEVTVLQDYVI